MKGIQKESDEYIGDMIGGIKHGNGKQIFK